MDDDLTEYPTHRVHLQQCRTCGRQFKAESLKKHQAVCRKVSTKKRKVFDAGKQRAQNSDVSYKATKRTVQIYNGEIRPQDSKPKSKSNWRERHRQLIQSIREARSVTYAMKQGGPLPPFQPSEIPSDYVSCPYCHRNFNEQAAKRHIPFCQTQHQRKQIPSSRPNQQFDRRRTLPPQHSSPYKQQPSSNATYSGSYDTYNNNNGYKYSNSAPISMRRNPHEFQPIPLRQPPPPRQPPNQRQPPSLPPPPPPRKTTGGVWQSFRRFFGFGSKEEEEEEEDAESSFDHYASGYEDDYYPRARRSGQQPVLMRTGRTQQNTSLNVRARQRNGETSSYMRRAPPPPLAAPPSYSPTRYQYGNGQYNYTRPTAVGRLPPSRIRCNECGSVFNNASARFCPQCGSRR